jgi:hypothetical protein
VRSAARLNRSVKEHAQHRRDESAQALRELRGIFAKARDDRPHWYAWVVDGCPPLTEAEYAASRKS